MHDLDEEIRRGLERLTEPADRNDIVSWEDLAARRAPREAQHPARLLAPIAVTTIVVVAILAVWVRLRDDTDVTTERGDAEAPASTVMPQLAVASIEVSGSGSTRGVEIVFDGPLPNDAVTFVEEIETADTADGIVYTIQPAVKVEVCENVHSFPPPADGTVDVLVPADWFAASDEPNLAPLQLVGEPAKFVACGPYNGFYQYSIWGPATIDPSGVTVTVENGGRSLVVSMLP